jgi:hypothetical protein
MIFLSDVVALLTFACSSMSHHICDDTSDGEKEEIAEQCEQALSLVWPDKVCDARSCLLTTVACLLSG